MHDGVSPQPENRSTAMWSMLDIGCENHVPPTLPAHTVRPMNCQLSSFFLYPRFLMFFLV